MYEPLSERVCVTMSVENWAKVVASIATSRLNLSEKDELNTMIYDCVSSTVPTG